MGVEPMQAAAGNRPGVLLLKPPSQAVRLIVYLTVIIPGVQ